MLRTEAKEKARLSLQTAAYSPAKLALIHTAAAAALGLLITVINYFLNQNMGPGGLAGMDTRAVLQTVQMVLSTGMMVVTPFWAVGLVYTMLQVARQDDAHPQSLLEGFRRFGAVLRFVLLQGALYFAVIMVCLNVATMLFTFTSLSNEAYAQLEAMATDANFVLDTEALMALLPTLIPAYVIFGILFCVLAIPLFYRFRMAQYVLMDQKNTGALAALVLSARMMKGHRLELFRMDLSYWWYYLLQVVIAVAAYLDVLLPALGITLPLSQDALLFGSFGVYLVLQLGFAYSCMAPVQTAYGCAYDILKAQMPPLPTAPQPPKNPWKTEQ